VYASSKTSKTVSRKFLKFEIFFSVSSEESGGRRSQREEEERSLVYIYIYPKTIHITFLCVHQSQFE